MCKGSTADSDSVCLGSNPSSAAKNRPTLWVGFFCSGQRNYGFRPRIYEHGLPSPKAKLADCAYRQRRYIAVRGDQSSPIAQSGTPTKEHTPSGKLCKIALCEKPLRPSYKRDAEGLASARSRSRSDNTPCCHSLRSRRYATSSPTKREEQAPPLRSGGDSALHTRNSPPLKFPLCS